MAKLFQVWELYNKEKVYSYVEHLKTCEYLDEMGKLSSLFMSLPVHSNNDLVWTDINRMNTLNTNQVNNKKEKHICPLQIDIIKRLINRFSNEGDIIDDCFGGLMSVPYVAMEMKRKSIGVELNEEYFKDGVFYVNSMHHKINIPTLFDMM